MSEWVGGWVGVCVCVCVSVRAGIRVTGCYLGNGYHVRLKRNASCARAYVHARIRMCACQVIKSQSVHIITKPTVKWRM